LSEREVDGLLEDEVLKKRDLLVLEKSSLKQCPTPNCWGKGIVEHDQLSCEICDGKFCGTCFGAHGVNETCEDLLE
jgi:hypothetical protein